MGTGVETRLTDVSAQDSNPSFSPDGSKIIFHSDRNPTGTGRALYIMNADGSEQTRLVESAEFADWASNGIEIVFVRGGNPWVVNADGSNPHALFATPNHVAKARFSPDGSQLLLDWIVGGATDVVVADLDGSVSANVGNDPAADFNGDWQPLLAVGDTRSSEVRSYAFGRANGVWGDQQARVRVYVAVSSSGRVGQWLR